MIGQSGPVDHFELVRWAREQAHPDKLHTDTDPKTGEELPERPLRPLEAHLLLLLAVYANKDGIAWPTVKALAEDVGYKVRERQRDGQAFFENRNVTEALAGLHNLRLIWNRRRGRGQSAERELLMPRDGEVTAHSEGGDEHRQQVRDQISESVG